DVVEFCTARCRAAVLTYPGAQSLQSRGSAGQHARNRVPRSIGVHRRNPRSLKRHRYRHGRCRRASFDRSGHASARQRERAITVAQTKRSPLLDMAGAVAATPPDSAVAAHYGDPLAEQHQLLDGTTVVDLSHRDVITVGGADRLSWLNDITTQDFAALEPHQWVSALILNPRGRVQYSLGACDDGERVWIHTEQGPALLEFLESMVFINRVELADVTSQWALLGHIRQTHDGDPAGAFGYQLVPRLQIADRRVSGIGAWEALRIAAGIPRIHYDTDERTIPNEIGMPGVSISK